MEGRLTDTAECGMTDVVLVPTPTGLVTVRTKVALGTELRTPGDSGGSDQIREILPKFGYNTKAPAFRQNFLKVLTLVWASLG